MNIRLQKYKKNRLKGMNIYNAARAAGYSHTYAHNADPEKLVKASLADAFEQAGFTDKKIVEFALEGMNATKLYGKCAVEAADWAARHRFFETSLKLINKLKDTPLIEQHTHLTFIRGALTRSENIDALGTFRTRASVQSV